jgi:hypothetical protein
MKVAHTRKSINPEEKAELDKLVSAIKGEMLQMVGKSQLAALGMCMTKVGFLLELVIDRLDRITNEIPVEPVRVKVEE